MKAVILTPPSHKSDIKRVSMENDSLKNELKIVKYYLEILKERVIIDTLKRR
jgi:hypothetical protein